LKDVADRYAAALLAVATAHQLASEARAPLGALGEIIAESQDLRLLLANPGVSRDKKVEIMDIFVGRIGVPPELRGMFRNFLLLILDHRRAALLPEIAASYTQKLNALLGIAVAEVSSAEELNGGERKELESELETVTRMKIQAHYDVDPALGGGAVVRIGDVIYDGSVREQLRRMEEQLAGE
jgi:F-type H+-transporting ATPase subunit delta